MLPRIDAARRGLERAHGGLVLLLADDARQAHALLLELLFRKNGRKEHFREHVEEHFAVAGERGRPDVHAHRIGGARGKREARAAALELLGDLELRAALGPLRELARRQGGDESAVRRRKERPALSEPDTARVGLK